MKYKESEVTPVQVGDTARHINGAIQGEVTAGMSVNGRLMMRVSYMKGGLKCSTWAPRNQWILVQESINER
ncbi:hypothetical protein KOR42_23690 [Thalassoglobus neptunius]|uniref:Uncharacterized protein n=1 Tax=Thalassoglobus neptunius TaxID=1938619 RepID=A0A5C5XAS8_9PLAN|nr:hypothetical protein [Thalassoglobus neptunius]TWT58982.1 hypothetical protein KOR42_23690 [Thalassoglobus neptunius]